MQAFEPQLLRKLTIPSKKSYGKYSGLFTSSTEGEGYDLYGVRLYREGDSVKKVDWNATARTGDLHVKVNHKDINVPVYIFVDQSMSMSYGRVRTKKEVSDTVLSFLCHVAVKEQNPVSILTNKRSGYFSKLSGRRKTYQYAKSVIADPGLEGTDSKGGEMLSRLSRPGIPSGAVVIISDFINTPEIISSFNALKQRHKVTAVRVYDEREYNLPESRGFLYMKDPENNIVRRIFIDKDTVSLYNKTAGENLTNLNHLMKKNNVYNIPIEVSSDVVATLRDFLHENRVSALDRRVGK